ncbi:MAG TPA: histidine kinase N-terminal 7TM domain-containing protein [Candidatus Aminicenantes bacterium]|nr:histidine kinase N-terminal 7TM domain-containing protein [Candidatus Aminicenantes bacterium]
MTFQFSPWAAVLVLGVVVSLFLAVSAWPKRRSPGGWPFFWLMLVLVWWQVFAALEFILVSPSDKILCSQFIYIAVSGVSLLFMLFCYDYYEFHARIPGVFRWILWIPGLVVAVLAFTNPLHHLVWTSITPLPGAKSPILVYSHGPAVWAHLGYAYTLVMIGTAILFGLIVKSKERPVRLQVVWLILGALTPGVSNLVYLLGLGPKGLDLTPFGFVLSGVFISRSFFRHHLLEITPVAFGSIFDYMTDAVIVFDDKNRVVEANPAAERLFEMPPEYVSRPFDKILERWPEYRDRLASFLRMTGARIFKGPRGANWLETRIFNIYGRSGEVKSWYLIARDITESHMAEEERAAAAERINAQRKALLDLSFSRAAAEGDFPIAIREITEALARNLEVERASFWLGNAREGLIRCIDLYERSKDHHAQGPVLMADRFPRYFEALARDRVIDASDAASDPRTREFTDVYFKPLGIGSLIDAPVRVAADVIGVICGEYVGPPRRWLEDEVRFVAEIADAAAHAYINWEKRTIEDARRESEERFRKLVEGAPDAIVVQAEGVFAYLNEAAVRLFGARSADQLLGRPFAERVRPEARPKLMERIKLINEKKRSFPHQEEAFLQLDGTPVETETASVPIRYRELDGALVFIRDIAERKRAEESLRSAFEEKVILLREVQSRVRNNMQIVTSLLNHQAAAISDPALRQAFRASRDRIKAMSLVHEKLYRSEDLARVDFADYIQSLVVHLFQVYQIPSERILRTFDLSPSVFGVDVSIPLGLILNELLVNALRHAFPDDRTGEIFIRLAEEQNGRHTLQVRDDGVGMAGPVDLAEAETIGFQLIGMLVEQIRGEVRIETAPGVSFTITFSDRPVEPPA